MAKLVLGNDFSGGVHGDAPALTVSLAITNLAAGAFGEMKRLQPAKPEVSAQFSCFAGTQVQILTQKALLGGNQMEART